LQAATGLDPGWHGVGGLRVATTPERVEELQRQASSAVTYGLDMTLLSPREAAEMLPLLAVDDVLLAGWLPGDGYLEPASLARALAAGAQRLGVEFVTGTAVSTIEVAGGRVRAVRTAAGRVECEHVVNAAGASAGVVGRLAGVAIPVVPMAHQYVVSSPLAESTVDLPTVRDPDNIVYFRGDPTGGILVGGYSRQPRTCWPTDPRADPLAQPRALFEPDLARFDESWQSAVRRFPRLEKATIARVVHGPEAFTPDGEFLLGEASVGGFWVAAGFCVHGLAAAGGVGKVIAEWIVDGTTEFDVSGMDIRRFGAHAASRAWATTKALDAYSRYYDVVYPHTEWSAGRPLRRSATWPRLLELDAALGEKAGWERANWFGRNATAATVEPPHGWPGRVWSPAIAAEVQATTTAAGLFDQSSFAKFDIDCDVAPLNRLCGNDIDKPPGTVVYTQLLNDRAGIEADLTITRLAETHFRVVTSTASGVRDLAWLRRHLGNVGRVVDVTGGYGCLCLWGPAAREILQPLVDTDLFAHRFMRAAHLAVGPVPVLAQRVTYVGELGWELYASTDYMLSLWDELMAAGGSYGLRPAGYRAIDSMRLEKGYRVWGSDITTDTTPDEAGLEFAVRTGKDFIGRDALLAARAGGGPHRRLRPLVLADPRTACLGTEPVRVDGAVCGRVTSGGIGYRTGSSIAYAYLPAGVAEGTAVEIGVFDRWQPATVVAEPIFDPGNARVLA